MDPVTRLRESVDQLVTEVERFHLNCQKLAVYQRNLLTISSQWVRKRRPDSFAVFARGTHHAAMLQADVLERSHALQPVVAHADAQRAANGSAR